MAGRQAIVEIEGKTPDSLDDYANAKSDKYNEMVERVRRRLNLTTLKYQELDDLVGAIGLPKEKLCTCCWDGCTGCKK